MKPGLLFLLTILTILVAPGHSYAAWTFRSFAQKSQNLGKSPSQALHGIFKRVAPEQDRPSPAQTEARHPRIGMSRHKIQTESIYGDHFETRIANLDHFVKAATRLKDQGFWYILDQHPDSDQSHAMILIGDRFYNSVKTPSGQTRFESLPLSETVTHLTIDPQHPDGTPKVIYAQFVRTSLKSVQILQSFFEARTAVDAPVLPYAMLPSRTKEPTENCATALIPWNNSFWLSRFPLLYDVREELGKIPTLDVPNLQVHWLRAHPSYDGTVLITPQVRRLKKLMREAPEHPLWLPFLWKPTQPATNQ